MGGNICLDLETLIPLQEFLKQCASDSETNVRSQKFSEVVVGICTPQDIVVKQSSRSTCFKIPRLQIAKLLEGVGIILDLITLLRQKTNVYRDIESFIVNSLRNCICGQNIVRNHILAYYYSKGNILLPYDQVIDTMVSTGPLI